MTAITQALDTMPPRRLGPIRMPRFDGTEACCNAHDVFDERGRNAENAKRALCHSCAWLPECFAWSVDCEALGFWAGLNPAQRERVRAKYGIQRRTVGGGQ